MKVIDLGSGVAPSVTVIPGGWRIAVGGLPEGIAVYDVDPSGHVIVSRAFSGFGFPVLDGPWLGYKCGEADGWCARLRNLATDDVWTYDPASGNFPLAIGSGVFMWQTGGAYVIKKVSLTNPVTASALLVGTGAPDGLAWVGPNLTVALVKDVRFSVPGMLTPSNPGYPCIGEQPDLATQWPLGMSTKANAAIRNGWLLGGQECNTPRLAVKGDSLAIVTWGREGVRLVLLTMAELLALPAPPSTGPIVPPPQPPQPPTPPPQPPIPPEPIMQGITDAQFATLQSERAKYPTNRALTREEIGAILNATAWTHRNDLGAKLGMQWKDPNTTVAIMPDAKRTPIWNGLRIIDKDGNHWGEDVCGGCSVGQFNPVRATPDHATASSFIAPVEPAGVVNPPQPPKPPDTPPPSTELDALKAELAVLRGDLHRLDERLMGQAEDVIAVRDRVLKLEQKPPVGGLPKFKIVVDPAAGSISTSRAYGHNHTVRLKVVPEEEAADGRA